MDSDREKFIQKLIRQLKKKKEGLKEKIAAARIRTSQAESARTSWSDHTLTDIEEEISILTQQKNTVKAQLEEIQAFLASPSSPDRAVPGSLVTIEIDGEKETLLIVRAAVGSFEDGLLSTQSPLGKALVNQKTGQDLTAPTPTKPLSVKLLKVA